MLPLTVGESSTVVPVRRPQPWLRYSLWCTRCPGPRSSCRRSWRRWRTGSTSTTVQVRMGWQKSIFIVPKTPLRLTTPFSLTHFCLKGQDPEHIFFFVSCNFGSASNSPDPEHWCRYRHGDYVLIDAVLYLLFFLLNRYERPVWDPRGGEADSSRSVPLCPPAGGWPAGEAPLLCHLRQVP